MNDTIVKREYNKKGTPFEIQLVKDNESDVWYIRSLKSVGYLWNNAIQEWTIAVGCSPKEERFHIEKDEDPELVLAWVVEYG